MIPEPSAGVRGAAKVFFAVGQHNAIGFSPFAIDRTGDAEGDKELTQRYDTLSQLAPLILENQPQGRVAGVLLEALTPSQKIRLGDYTLHVVRRGPRFPLGGTSVQAPSEPTPHGIFIATGPDEIYMAGDGLTVTFAPVTPGPPMVGLGTVEESHFEAVAGCGAAPWRATKPARATISP